MVLSRLSKKQKSKLYKSRRKNYRKKINKKSNKRKNIRRKMSKKGGRLVDKRELYSSDKTLHLVCGLAGDFCVLDTALNIKSLYPNTNVRFLTYFTRFVFSNEPTELPPKVEEQLQKANITYIKSNDSEVCHTPESAGKIALAGLDIPNAYEHIVLWVIDMQNDFIERKFSGKEDEGAFEKGAFAVPGTSTEQGCKLVEDISELIKYFGNRPDTEIVVSRDYHPVGHCSFDIFPPHCVEGTIGAQMNETILKAFENIPEDKYSVIFKGCEPETDSYGAVIYSDNEYLTERSPSCNKRELDKTGGRNNPNMSSKEALLFNEEIKKVFVKPISGKL